MLPCEWSPRVILSTPMKFLLHRCEENFKNLTCFVLNLLSIIESLCDFIAEYSVPKRVLVLMNVTCCDQFDFVLCVKHWNNIKVRLRYFLYLEKSCKKKRCIITSPHQTNNCKSWKTTEHVANVCDDDRRCRCWQGVNEWWWCWCGWWCPIERCEVFREMNCGWRGQRARRRAGINTDMLRSISFSTGLETSTDRE